MPPPKKKKKADPESPAEPAGEKKEAYRVQCKAGLLTYNNSLIQSIEGLEKHHEELRAKFPNHDLELSSCVEKESRLHMHTFFSSDTKMDCDLSNFSTAMSGKVDDCKPNRGTNVARGHYYCQCKWKSSQICCKFDIVKHPCGEWLMNYWKDGKVEKIIEALAAEKLLTPRFQMQIQAVNNYNEKVRVEKMLAERKHRMQRKLKKFAVIPKVQVWLEQYESEEFRYKFLVLHGPSQMRKTQFARSLFKNPHVHQDKIDWDGYSWESNDAIIFDDVNIPDHIWRFVKINKVLMQAQQDPVPVNVSATNCFKRDICVCQKPIVICTNDNLLDPFVSAEYRLWIEANCVWLDVEEPIAYFDDVCVPIEDTC